MVILVLLLVENRKHEGEVLSNGMMFITSLMAIHVIIPKLLQGGNLMYCM
jgi:hypothetical protein